MNDFPLLYNNPIITMSSNTIILHRLQNELKLIKRNLSLTQHLQLYNDMLILNEIVPKLPEETQT